MSYSWVLTLVLILSVGLRGGLAQQCGEQAGGTLCPDGFCCSKHGYCGTTSDYCGDGCQSGCWSPPPPPSPTPPPPPPAPPPSGAITDIITSEMFDQLLPYRNDDRCPAKNFYTYDAFVSAANLFPAFATTGDNETRIREVTAFLAQTSHETTGGWDDAPGGTYAWGYCYVKEKDPTWDYCVQSVQWPCASGKAYYGRGPIQLSYNFNYGQAGAALGLDLLNDPDLAETDVLISFETALWFWMTPQPPKPSCHDVITGNWTPSEEDIEAGRLPGYGVITNIINGGVECGHGWDAKVQNRIGFYEKFCQMLGVSTGDNLDCFNQTPFNSSAGVLLDSI